MKLPEVAAIQCVRAKSYFQVPDHLIGQAHEIVTKDSVLLRLLTLANTNPLPGMSELQASGLSGMVALKLRLCQRDLGGFKVHTTGPDSRISDEAILRSDQASI